mgnify:CR=1 FL=1
MKDIIILGIESSCDETSVAIVKNGREVLSNVINTQISIHELYGGVVPEIASRNHVENISPVMKEALKEANIKIDDVDGIACTYGPGLVGALLVGVSYAKALSYAANKPLIGVNHIQGHIAANYITYKDLKPPFLTLLISGGNTQLVLVKDYTEFEILGKTRDDAVGEAFDKIARVIGLGYPGGPKMDKLAQDGTPNIDLPKVHIEGLDFSFSGLKSSVINLKHNEEQRGNKINDANLAASFQNRVIKILTKKTMKALKKYNVDNLIIAGGVSANKGLRDEFKKLCDENNINLSIPDLKYCTDNAAMIGAAGYYAYKLSRIANLDLNSKANDELR